MGEGLNDSDSEIKEQLLQTVGTKLQRMPIS